MCIIHTYLTHTHIQLLYINHTTLYSTLHSMCIGRFRSPYRAHGHAGAEQGQAAAGHIHVS